MRDASVLEYIVSGPSDSSPLRAKVRSKIPLRSRHGANARGFFLGPTLHICGNQGLTVEMSRQSFNLMLVVMVFFALLIVL